MLMVIIITITIVPMFSVQVGLKEVWEKIFIIKVSGNFIPLHSVLSRNNLLEQTNPFYGKTQYTKTNTPSMKCCHIQHLSLCSRFIKYTHLCVCLIHGVSRRG